MLMRFFAQTLVIALVAKKRERRGGGEKIPRKAIARIVCLVYTIDLPCLPLPLVSPPYVTLRTILDSVSNSSFPLYLLYAAFGLEL